MLLSTSFQGGRERESKEAMPSWAGGWEITRPLKMGRGKIDFQRRSLLG
jgi:hypothetical protein